MNIKIISLLLVLVLAIGSFGVFGTSINTEVENNCECDDSNEKCNAIVTENGYYLGFIPSKNPVPPGRCFVGNAPSSWDWRYATYNGKTGDWTTSIKDQGKCGSCYAFGSLAAFESLIKMKNNDPNYPIDLSEQFMVSCGYGCSGASTYQTFDFIKIRGAIPESCFPYTSGNTGVPPCSNKCEDYLDKEYKIGGWDYISSNSNDIKNALVQHGPLPVGMKVYDDFEFYRGGIYEPSGSFVGMHLVTLVGYDDSQNCWICKNSWGEDWGEENPYDPSSQGGWFKLKYGKCDLEQYVYCVDLDKNTVYFENIVCGDNYIEDESGGDINHEGDCWIHMSQDIGGGGAHAVYKFDLNKITGVKYPNVNEKSILQPGMEVGIRFKDIGLFGNGPNLYVRNWVGPNEWDNFGTDMGDNDNFVWVWKDTKESNKYVDDEGLVKIKVTTTENDHTVLYEIGVRGRVVKPDIKFDPNFGLEFLQSVPPGSQQKTVLRITNYGYDYSILNWKIESWPGWGEWSFSPKSGGDVIMGEWETIDVIIDVPNEKQKFTGEVKIINLDDPNDSVVIPVYISTPRARQVSNPLVHNLLERFPIFRYFFSILL